MLNNNLHLFFKFSEYPSGENGIETMKEHLEVMKREGSVIWGHFSSDPRKKELWKERINTLRSQIKSGEESFVIFCDKKTKLLYIGRYVESWAWADIDKTSKEMKFIPKYYHDKVGLPADGKLRCYCYVKVDHIKEYQFSDNDYIFGKNGKAVENKGQNSVFYVNFEETFYENLRKEYLIFNEIIDSTEKENIEIELEIKKKKKMPMPIIQDVPKPIPEKFVITSQTKIKRNTTTLTNVIITNEYSCEYNPEHKTFISERTGENYVEGHHFIPLEHQDDFENSLDVESNIISLCPNCHRLLHYGTLNEKEVILENLYNERKERLENAGISITFKQLLKYYK